MIINLKAFLQSKCKVKKRIVIVLASLLIIDCIAWSVRQLCVTLLVYYTYYTHCHTWMVISEMSCHLIPLGKISN